MGGNTGEIQLGSERELHLLVDLRPEIVLAFLETHVLDSEYSLLFDNGNCGTGMWPNRLYARMYGHHL